MFLDLGLAVFATILFDIHLDTGIFPLLYWALLFSVILDLDFVIHKLFKPHTEHAYLHRNLLHYPLLVLPIGFLGIYFFSTTLALLFAVMVFLHFLHDSTLYGRGIKWLYPFSKNSYAFIYLYAGTRSKGLWQPVFIFNENNLPQWDKDYSDDNWIKNIYHKLHPIALIEYGTFIASLISLFFYLN